MRTITEPAKVSLVVVKRLEVKYRKLALSCMYGKSSQTPVRPKSARVKSQYHQFVLLPGTSAASRTPLVALLVAPVLLYCRYQNTVPWPPEECTTRWSQQKPAANAPVVGKRV